MNPRFVAYEEALRAVGTQVWVDYSGIRAGDRISANISKALEGCDVVLLVWSGSANKSQWVAKEWGAANSDHKVIIPCLLDSTKVPALLTDNARVDLRDFEKGVAYLLRTLNFSEPQGFATTDEQSDNAAKDGKVAVKVDTREIELKIDRDFNSYTKDEQEHLLRAIREFLGMNSEIRITKIRRGSVLLSLKLSPEKAEKLYWAAKSGEFEKFAVVDAELKGLEETEFLNDDTMMPFRQLSSHYPLVAQGVLNVDQIDWERSQRAELSRGHQYSSIKSFVNKFLNPTIFLVINCIILVVPRAIVKFLSKAKSQGLRQIAIRTIDIVGACIGIIFSLPFLIVVPILIKLNSPGPVYYRQIRIGIDRRRRNRRVANIGHGENRRHADSRTQNLYGKPFVMYKFRTMKDNAERHSGAVWAIPEDPRITTVGRWLRKYHIDDVPQLWNVLKGEMSLVGPRPERPEIISKLIVAVPKYRQRLYVKPGITGLAQICLGYDTCLEDVKRKVKFDLFYVSHQSLRLYFSILLHTLIKIVVSKKVDIRQVVPGDLLTEE